jgi:flagellar biosynthetic protein FliQ
MTPETVLSIGQQALQVTVLLSAPLLLSALVIGVLIGMFQAATQINEMTLSFIPKLLVLVIALFVAGPWMLQLLVDYTQRLIGNIPFLIG